MTVYLKQDDGKELHLEDVTIEDITNALEYYKRQRELQQAKYKRLYVPTGKPIGRPKKTKSEENQETQESIVKKPVGRPKKPLPEGQLVWKRKSRAKPKVEENPPQEIPPVEENHTNSN